MVKRPDTKKARLIRHKRVRGKLSGTADCPRLNVFRSLKHIYAQLIDDTKGVTLVSASTLDPAVRGQLSDKDKKGAANLVGKTIGERALQAGFKSVVFDRGGYVYTGRVQAVAEGAREAGLEF